MDFNIIMKKVLLETFAHEKLYFASISIGSILASIFNFFYTLHEKQLLGVSLTLWAVPFLLNIIDIHTGIKASTKLKKDKGEKFVFESGKGWRAFEKIIIFTLIIWWLWSLEKEAIRLDFYSSVTLPVLVTIKFILMIYVSLIELQSIGENEETRFGKKSKLFVLLDKIIEVVNDGIINRIKKVFE